MKKLTDKTMVEVWNNSDGVVFYNTDLNRAKRRWETVNAVKKISLEELKELVQSAGGYDLLRDDLLIKDGDVRVEIGLPVDEQSVMDGQAVSELLNKPIAQLKTTLEDATDAIKDKIVRLAIETELSDIKKIELIKEHTNVDVYEIIKANKEQ